MTKKMLINASHTEENRVAIVDEGILTELDIEIAGREQTKGNIYKATVVRVEQGLQAAFIDFGAERLGFLQMGEIHPTLYRHRGEGDKGRPRINDILHRGQELLVQVVKEERGTKGAALTTFLSLPGRFMVLMPGSDLKGLSRKIEDAGERKELKAAMALMEVPADMGYIVRTASIGKSKEELNLDLDYLMRLYRNIQEKAGQVKAPALIYKESNLVIRSIRDYFSTDMDEVLVDDPRVFQEARDFFQQVMPDYARLVKLHQERRPIFSRYQIEEQIETIYKNKVLLPSGGSIVIDATEALVAIDVNSGKMSGEHGVESTAYKTNLEAATESARQLRLRDLGGLIVIDFIDMRDRKHIREIEKRLKDSLKGDKARVTVGRISQFGLLEMSRQRIKATLAEGAYRACPHCEGRGRVKSPEAQAVAFLRRIHAAAAKGKVAVLEGDVPQDVANYLLNYKREELLEMERRYQLAIVIEGDPDMVAGQSELTVQKKEREEEAAEMTADVPLRKAEAPMALEEEASPRQTEQTPSEAEEGPAKRKRRRRKKKKPGEEAAPAPAQSAATPETDEEEAEESSAEGTEESRGTGEEGKKKRRRRRRKKKSAEGAPLTGEAQALPEAPAEKAAESQPPPASPSQGEAPKKRPARKKPAPKKSQPEGEEAVVVPQEKAASPPAEEKAEMKPAARRVPKKKTEGEKTVPAATEPPAAVPAETPKKASPRKKAPAQKTEASTAEAAGGEPPEKKPAPKRTVKKKVAEEEKPKV